MNQDQFRKQAPVALLAITQHMVDNSLPTPWSIDVDDEKRVVAIRVFGGGHDAWLNSVEVVEEINEPAPRENWMRTAWTLRLPVGVQFDLVTYREQPLRLVSA